MGIKCEIISLLIVKDYKGSSCEIKVDQAGRFITKLTWLTLRVDVAGQNQGAAMCWHHGQRGLQGARPPIRVPAAQRLVSRVIKNYGVRGWERQKKNTGANGLMPLWSEGF